MAGWLKKVDGSGVEERFDTPQKALKTEAGFQLESENNIDKKIKSLFDEFLEIFLKEVSGISCFRPLPPVIGEGQEVDLLKLHIVVRKRGGYCSVSENRLWDLVAIDCGLDLKIGAALKLVYVKYLDTLDKWLGKIVKDKQEENTEFKEKCHGFSGFWMEVDSDLKVFLSGFPDKINKDEESKKNALDSGNDDKSFVDLNVDAKSESKRVNVNVYRKECIDKGGNGDDRANDEDSVSRKRKRECYLGMLSWIGKVAKDPCNPAIGSLPEKHKWKSYGSELQWKQILLARESMLLKKNVDKNQKMHPSMYDDQCGSERLRCSQRLLFAKDSSRKARELLGSESSSSGCQNDEDLSDKQYDSTADSVGFWCNNHRHKRIPLGPLFQADLPEFCGADYKSDSKWLGTPIWPLDKAEQKKSLIERDPIGKGRQQSCGCQFPGSPECVRFHIGEKRMKVKLELGSAFYKWKFDGMGEEVALCWTKEDENKFQDIVKSNSLTDEKYFWDELFKSFPRKGREALVSFYFNVFLLRRRGHQNRSGTSNIDSDDEESEFGPIANRFGQNAANSPGSIFCSPKRSHLNSR